MSVGRPLSALNFYDVLTDLIPGVTFFGGLALLLRPETVMGWNLGVVLAVITIGGYVAGHVLQSARSKIWGTPDLFQRVARDLHDGESETDLGRVSEVEAEFLSRCREQFALTDGFTDWSTLFRLVVSYLETQPERRALRFQALHSFYWSMAAAFFGLALLAAGATSATLAAHIGVLRPPEATAGVLLVGGVLGVVFELRRREFQRHFVRYLIVDFHVATSRNDPPQ